MDGCEGIENRGGSPGPLAAAWAVCLTPRSPARGCDASLLSAIATGREPVLKTAVMMEIPGGGRRRRVSRGDRGGSP